MSWANHHAVKLWNASSLEELVARDFTDTSEATKERLANYRRKFLQGETVTEQWTFYPKGVPRVAICNCSGVLIEGGRQAMVVEGRSISKTDIEPNTLRCVEALHHTSLLVSIFGLDGELLFQNPSASKTFPHQARQFISRFHDGETAKQMWDEVTSGKFVSRQVECVTTNGVRWYGIDCKLVRDPVEGGQVVLCNQQDLHVLKLTELKLERAVVDVQEMAQTKTRFLANMSHEIRTPLNGVLGMAQLLAGSELSKTQSQYVTHMQDAAHILRTLIDDILDYSKLQAGHLRLSPKPFSLQRCFKTCVALIEPTAREKRLKFRVSAEIPENLTLLGDEVRLTQVLINMLTNAVKFTHEGEVFFSVLPILQSKEVCALKIVIADTGIGIAADDQKKLFSRFTQLDNSLRRGQAGTGLGLAICRELIDLMYGHVAVESEVNEGTKFTIEMKFPVVVSETDASASERDRIAETKPLDVLLVEDNLTNQMVAKRMLVKLGHRCRVAKHGGEALEKLAQKKPDLILMDVVMPVMDGITATRLIRKNYGDGPRIPVIALTANVMKEERAEYLASGMDDFMAKPLDMGVLRAKLTQWAPHLQQGVVPEEEP